MEITETLIIKIIGLFLLGFSLWTGRKICKDIMENIDKFGDDKNSKHNVATRALFNFWIGFAAILIIISAIFKLISNGQFFFLLTAILTTLGVKLSTEIYNTFKIK